MKLDELKAVVEIFKQADLTEMALETGEFKIKLARQIPVEGVFVKSEPSACVRVDQPASLEESKATEENEGDWITSPLVGTFYQSDVQNGAPLVCVGDKVKKGDLLCIVEAMKMMNETRSDRDGTILKVAVENGALVEYGQPLFCIGEYDD